MKHTPEPWNTITEKSLINRPFLGTLIRHEGLILAKMRESEFIDHEANAERIVACVNACAGIPNELLNEPFSEIKELHFKLKTAKVELRNVEDINAKLRAKILDLEKQLKELEPYRNITS